jgi:hypothetical protein
VLRAVALSSSLLALAALGSPLEPDAGISLPLQLEVRANPTTVKLGEPFAVEIMVTHAPTQRYELKTPGDLGDFDYRGQERRRVDGPDSSTTTITVHLAAFVLGKQRTPALTLELADPQGATELDAAGTDVEVVTGLPPDAKDKGEALYDVRPPEEMPVRTWRVLYALAALLGLIALVQLVRKFLARARLTEALAPPPEPMDVRALKALDALAALNLPGQGQFKPFYFRLSEIVRGYLGERYAFEAMECTTPELLDAVRTRETPGLAVDALTEFAQGSDFIRYARSEPSVDDCKRHLDLSYRIVRETTVAARAAAAMRAAATPGQGNADAR